MSRLTFLYQMDLPHRAVAVYTYLHDRANKNGECWPSVNKIAGDIMTRPPKVRPKKSNFGGRYFYVKIQL